MNGSYFGALLRTLFSLAIVIGLIYIVVKYLLPKTITAKDSKWIKILERIPLEPQASLYLVKFAKKIFLLGISSKGISMVSSVNEEELKNSE